MSNSLLTLLEIMDQVVQEEEAGASGGGEQAITNMTEEELKTELIDYITNLINETFDEQTKKANNSRDGRFRPAALIKQFEYNQDENAIRQLYFEKDKETNKWKRKKQDIWEGKEKNWDNIYERFLKNHVAQTGNRSPLIREKIYSLFNNFFVSGLISNAKKEGSFTLTEDFVNIFVQDETMHLYQLFMLPKRGIKTIFSPTPKNTESFYKLAKIILEYLKSGKAYYNTILKFSEQVTRNVFIATEEEEEKLNVYDGVYIVDNALLEVFKKQILSGNFVNLPNLTDNRANIKDKNKILGNIFESKILEIIKEFALENPMITKVKILPYLASTGFESLEKEFPELSTPLEQDPSFTKPSIKTSSGQLSSDFISTIDEFMEGANGFENRIERYKEKMKMFSNAKLFNQKIETINPVDFLNRVVLLDYFVEFSKGFNAPTAGYMFELFLAGLLGGEHVGAEEGVADIKLGDIFISAKLLSPGSSIVGSLKNFQSFSEQNPEKNITYIVGRKKKGKIDLPTVKKKLDDSTETLEIVEVDLFKFNAKFIEEVKVKEIVNKKEKDVIKAKFQINNKHEINFPLYGDTVYFKGVEEYMGPPFSTIPIMSASEGKIQSYRQTLNNKLDALNATDESNASKIKKILNKVQEIFDNIKEGEISARDYVNTGNREKGTEAVEKLNSSTKFIDQMMNNLNYGTESQNQEDS